MGKKKITLTTEDSEENITQNKATFIRKTNWDSRHFMVQSKNVQVSRRVDELVLEDARRKDPRYNQEAEAKAKAQKELEAKIKKKTDTKNIRPS